MRVGSNHEAGRAALASRERVRTELRDPAPTVSDMRQRRLEERERELRGCRKWQGGSGIPLAKEDWIGGGRVFMQPILKRRPHSKTW